MVLEHSLHLKPGSFFHACLLILIEAASPVLTSARHGACTRSAHRQSSSIRHIKRQPRSIPSTFTTLILLSPLVSMTMIGSFPARLAMDSLIIGQGD